MTSPRAQTTRNAACGDASPGKKSRLCVAMARAISDQLNERKLLFRKGAGCSPPEPMAGEEGEAERAHAAVSKASAPALHQPDGNRRPASPAVVAEMPERWPVWLRGAPVSTRQERLSAFQPFARPEDPCDRKRIWHASGRRGKELTVASVKCQRFSPAGDLHITAQPGRRPTSAPAGSACRTCVAPPPGPR